MHCHGRAARRRAAKIAVADAALAKARPKTKDPSGGTTGRVKPYGRLGWMGARAEYSLDGEGLPLPPILVAVRSPHVQTTGDFFGTFLAGAALRLDAPPRLTAPPPRD